MTEVQTFLKDEQEKLLKEAKQSVETQAFMMKRCLDKDQLMDALKHAVKMISVLSTSLLTPRSYYDLYMSVFNELVSLEAYLTEEAGKGKKVANLYEIVQYAGNVLPRLYLMICVGSVYIKSKSAAAKDVLRDLVEMCKGVQNPMRGLFLRNYLSQMAKEKLPDLGSEYYGEGGTVKDSIDFILQNFVEMNKLWVRMQHQGVNREKERRESERQELRILVGTNLVRLSQLEGVNEKLYAEVVLPKVLSQVIKCSDVIAQQYLMESLVQVFPDEFHLATLPTLLKSLQKMDKNLDLKSIFVSLLDRLNNFVANGGEIPEDMKIMEVFSSYMEKIVQMRETVPKDRLLMQASLLRLSVRTYPRNLGYVDFILQNCFDALSHAKEKELQELEWQILDVLMIPLICYKKVAIVLHLNNFKPLLEFLGNDTRKQLAENFCETMTSNFNSLQNSAQLEDILEFIDPLLTGEQGGDGYDEETVNEDMLLVSRCIHIFKHGDLEEEFKMLKILWSCISRPEVGVERQVVLFVPYLFSLFNLALKMKGELDSGNEFDGSIKSVLQLAYTALHHTPEGKERYVMVSNPQMALKLFMNAARTADICGFTSIAYHFSLKAFIIFEEELTDTKSRFPAILDLIGMLQTMKSLGEDNYSAFRSNLKGYAKHRLMKINEKCRAMFQSSHLFWFPQDDTPPYDGGSDNKAAVDCLKGALQTLKEFYGEEALVRFHLYVEALNEYLYYFENGNDEVSLENVSTLIQLIKEVRGSIGDDSEEARSIVVYFKNTLNHIALRKSSGMNGKKYKDLDAPQVS